MMKSSLSICAMTGRKIPVEDLCRNFDSSGKPKPTVKLEILIMKPKKKRLRKKTEFKNPKTVNWPEAFFANCDDIYYNTSNKIEDKQMELNKFTEYLVPCDTVTTFYEHKDTTVPFFCPCCVMRAAKNLIPNSFLTPGYQNYQHVNRNINYTVQNADPSLKYYTMNGCSVMAPNEIENFSLIDLEDFTFNQRLFPQRMNPVTKGIKVDIYNSELEKAVNSALGKNGISKSHSLYAACFLKLSVLCDIYLKDLVQNSAAEMKILADIHVKTVIDFELQKLVKGKT